MQNRNAPSSPLYMLMKRKKFNVGDAPLRVPQNNAPLRVPQNNAPLRVPQNNESLRVPQNGRVGGTHRGASLTENGAFCDYEIYKGINERSQKGLLPTAFCSFATAPLVIYFVYFLHTNPYNQKIYVPQSLLS